jgi:hypothetical protein
LKRISARSTASEQPPVGRGDSRWDADRARSHASRAAALVRLLLPALLLPAGLAAQNEPEAPQEPVKLHNGFQISVYTGASYNTFSGGYSGNCPCDFVASEHSFNLPFGVALNIPVFEDASLYLRAGWQGTSTSFFTGRVDSLRSQSGGYGDIGSELRLDYTLFQVDILARLIGRQNGERVFFGLGLGAVREKHVHITDAEYATGAVYTVTDSLLAGARTLRTSFVIGAEYAFVPLADVYVIPSLQIDYGLENISEVQPLRPNFFKFLVTIAFQPF